MTEREIARALAGTELVTVMKGPIAYIKELRQRCVDAELPAMLGACKGKS
jgi:hypothetical protein